MTRRAGPDITRERKELDALQERIDEAKRHLAEMTGEDSDREMHFYDDGRHRPVDDTIAP